MKCKNCGADFPYVPEGQAFICPYCGTSSQASDLTEEELNSAVRAEEQHIKVQPEDEQEPALKEELPDESANPDEDNQPDLENIDEIQANDSDSEYIDTIVFTCPQCGGELYTTEETAATFCSYCGTSVLLERRVSKELKPNYIIPFSVSKDDAARNFKERTKKAIFAPSYIRHLDIEKIRGIYMPYWTYTVSGSGPVKVRYESYSPARDGRYLNVYDVKAAAEILFDGIEYDAAKSFPDNLSEKIAPFDFDKAEPYAPAYMSGFYADAGDVDENDNKENSISAVTEHIDDEFIEKLSAPGGTIMEKPELESRGERALYPVWFVSAKSKGSSRVSYGIVNGQSGKTAIDLPIDIKKLFLGTFIIGIPLFFLLYLLFTPTPAMSTVGVMACSFVGFLGSYLTLAQRGAGALKKFIWTLPVGLLHLLMYSPGFFGYSDTSRYFTAIYFVAVLVHAFTSVNILRDTAKKEMRIYFWPCLINILSIALCFAVLVINPVDDVVYYAFIIAATVLNAISYLVVFMLKNRLSKRKLPQLGKRGGDGA